MLISCRSMSALFNEGAVRNSCSPSPIRAKSEKLLTNENDNNNSVDNKPPLKQVRFFDGNNNQHLNSKRHLFSYGKNSRNTVQKEIHLVPHWRDMTQEEREETWYNGGSNIDTIYAAMILVASLVQRPEIRRFLSDLVDVSSDKSDLSFFSTEYKQENGIEPENELDHYCELNRDNCSPLFTSLVTWCEDSSRGMESNVSPKFLKEKTSSIRAVIEIQNQQRIRRKLKKKYAFTDEELKMISDAYSQHTKGPQKLACALAAADAMAL